MPIRLNSGYKKDHARLVQEKKKEKEKGTTYFNTIIQ